MMKSPKKGCFKGVLGSRLGLSLFRSDSVLASWPALSAQSPEILFGLGAVLSPAGDCVWLGRALHLPPELLHLGLELCDRLVTHRALLPRLALQREVLGRCRCSRVPELVRVLAPPLHLHLARDAAEAPRLLALRVERAQRADGRLLVHMHTRLGRLELLPLRVDLLTQPDRLQLDPRRSLRAARGRAARRQRTC